MDDELEELRKKRLKEIENQISAEDIHDQEDTRAKEYEAQKQAILRQILTNEARERLGRIRMARPEVVNAIESQLIALAQSGRLRNKINDAQLRELLSRAMPKKRETTIKRRGI